MGDEFATRLKTAQDATEAVLEKLLADEPLAGEIARPPRLLAAMRYAALGGGKRLRPFIVVESARLFGRLTNDALGAAAALECVHCYSLVHDDLPAMDDDDLRRGRPTVHKAYDEATAILAGDALLTLAFAVLADPATDPDPAVRAELSASLAAAAGLGGMAGGQMLDLAGGGAARGEADIRLMQAMKTGALFRHAAEAGAILGRAGDKERKSLADFGAALGLAFQLADDLIDATASAETAGKATAKDAARGKATLVAVHGVEGAIALLDDGGQPGADHPASLRLARRHAARGRPLRGGAGRIGEGIAASTAPPPSMPASGGHPGRTCDRHRARRRSHLVPRLHGDERRVGQGFATNACRARLRAGTQSSQAPAIKSPASAMTGSLLAQGRQGFSFPGRSAA